MDRITFEQLGRIFVESHPGFCVSLYMPAHRAGRETEQDPIRFKNLLRQAEERLLAEGMRSAEARNFLKEPQRLLQDQSFWRHQSDGLALFYSEDIFHFFRLPVRFAELVVVADRFHVKPLLPILTSDSTFFILAASQNQLRLLEGTRHTVDEIELEGVPQNFAETLPDGFPEKQLQFHTGTPSGTGNRPAVFHGHESNNEIKNRIRQWFRIINKHIRGILAERAVSPGAGRCRLPFPALQRSQHLPASHGGRDSGKPRRDEARRSSAAGVGHRRTPIQKGTGRSLCALPATGGYRKDHHRRHRGGPGGGSPTGPVAQKIASDLGGYEKFVQEFKNAAMTQFGSGWAWLVLRDGKLESMKTPNADTPIAHGLKPVLTVDVWEHAYYLDYQNRRGDYLDVFMNHLVNWEFVNSQLA